jgi:hypothetical protein
VAFVWHAASRGHAACCSDVRDVDCRSHGGHWRIQRNRQVHLSCRTGANLLPTIDPCNIGRLLCSQPRCRSRCLGPRCQTTMGATCGHCWRRCTTTRTTRQHRTRLRGYTSSSEGIWAVTCASHSLCLYCSTWNNLYTSTAGGQHVARQEGSTS